MSLVINNFILVISSFVVLIGTMYPLLLELTNGTQITVGKPYFLMTLSPLMILTLFFMGIGPLLYWKRNYLSKVINIFIIPIVISSIIFICFILFSNFPLVSLIGFSLSAWLIFNILYSIIKDTNLLTVFRKNKNVKLLTSHQLAVCIAHIGVAIFSIGAVTENYFNTEIIKQVKLGEKFELGDDYFIFEDIKQNLGPNFISEIGKLVYYDKNGNVISTLYPEKRLFPTERQSTTEVAIYRKLFGDVYAVIGDGDNDKGYTFRVYSKPLVSLIWIGSLIMALGGMLSLKTKFKRKNFQKINEI